MKSAKEEQLELIQEQAAYSVSSSPESATEYLESLKIDSKAMIDQLAMRIRRNNFDRLSSANLTSASKTSKSITAELEEYARGLVVISKEALAKVLRQNVPSFQFRNLEENGLTKEQMVQILMDRKKADLLENRNQK